MTIHEKIQNSSGEETKTLRALEMAMRALQKIKEYSFDNSLIYSWAKNALDFVEICGFDLEEE